jgi:hypothetical protein
MEFVTKSKPTPGALKSQGDLAELEHMALKHMAGHANCDPGRGDGGKDMVATVGSSYIQQN